MVPCDTTPTNFKQFQHGKQFCSQACELQFKSKLLTIITMPKARFVCQQVKNAIVKVSFTVHYSFTNGYYSQQKSKSTQ